MAGTGDDSFFLSTEAEEVHRDTYRIFCVLTSVLSPAFGWIYHVTDPAALDPMWARVGMAIPTLLLLSLSYANSWVKKHFIPLVHLLFYLLTAYFIGITAVNSFSPNYALGALFSMTGIGVAFGLGLKTLRPLAFYLCSAVTMCLAAVWLTPQPEVSSAIMSISVVSTGLVIYVAARSRVRAEQTVAATEKRYHSLMESANDAIFIADADRNMLVEANEQAQKLIGRSLDEIKRMRPEELFPPPERDHYTTLFKKHLYDGQPISEEVTLWNRSGDRIPVDISASLTEIDGKNFVQAIFRDVTARRRYEERLIKAKEHAEEMHRLKSSILNNMSHEIRTPLTGILGFAEMLSGDLAGEEEEHARIIMQSAERLMRTLDSVLELAQLERGETDLELEAIDLAEEVESSVVPLKQMADEKELTFQFIVSSPEVRIRADEAFTHRIVTNLVSNAIKFTHEGRVTVEVGTREDEAFLRVTDTGVGIDADFQENLFDAFTQESTGLGRSHEGSGLGLAITKRLVDRLGGTITVESRRGEGSTFTVRFPRVSNGPAPERPLAPEASVADDGNEALAPSTGEATDQVLVVEDDSSTRNLVDHHLRSFWEVRQTESPEEALDLARNEQFSVFLLDISLTASMDGIELLASLRDIPHCEEVPAVALTAHALPGDQERFLDAGFDQYVAKPFTAEQLRAGIGDVLEDPSGFRADDT